MFSAFVVFAALFGGSALCLGLIALRRSRGRAYLKARQIRLKDLPDK